MSNNDVMSDAPTAARPYVASKWVTWLLLFFGICEVPWVIYLIFFQPTTVEAYHVRLTGAGLGIGVRSSGRSPRWQCGAAVRAQPSGRWRWLPR